MISGMQYNYELYSLDQHVVVALEPRLIDLSFVAIATGSQWVRHHLLFVWVVSLGLANVIDNCTARAPVE